MDLDSALDFARQRRQGVVVTIKRDGRSQLSNISYHLGDDGRVRISITADRAKYHNLVRDPRVALHMTRDDFYAYTVLEGDAELTAPAGSPEDGTVEALIALYRDVAGEHPDWDEYRRAMVADHRVVLAFTPTHAYGWIS